MSKSATDYLAKLVPTGNDPRKATYHPPEFWVEAAAVVTPADVVNWFQGFSPRSDRLKTNARRMLMARYYLHGIGDKTKPTLQDISREVSKVHGLTTNPNTVAGTLHALGIANRKVDATASATRAVQQRYVPRAPIQVNGRAGIRWHTMISYEEKLIMRLAKGGMDSDTLLRCLNFARRELDPRTPLLPDDVFAAHPETICNVGIQRIRRTFVRGRGQYLKQLAR